jgi:hypothetical protein
LPYADISHSIYQISYPFSRVRSFIERINPEIMLNGVLFLQEPHSVTSQKTPFFIVTAVKTSDLTEIMLFQAICNKPNLYSKKLFALCPTPKLEYCTFSVIHNLMFNIFSAALHIWKPSHQSAT